MDHHHHHRIDHPQSHLHHHHNHDSHRFHHQRNSPFPPPPPPMSRVPPLSPLISSSHHHHHQPQQPQIVYDDRPLLHPVNQFRDFADDFSSSVDRRRFEFVEPRVSPLSPAFHRQVDFRDCLSPPLPLPLHPPPFVDFVDGFSHHARSPRFTEEIDLHRHFRYDESRRNFGVVDRDELHGVRIYDERRSMDVFEREELGRNVVYDDWRSMEDFEREELLRRQIDERRRVMDDLEKEEFLRRQNRQNMIYRDEWLYDHISDERRVMSIGLHQDPYRTEVSFRGPEIILGRNDLVGGEVVDSVRLVREEIVHMPMNLVRHGGFDPRSEVVDPPLEFRARNIEGEERFSGFHEEQRKYGLRVEQGRSESEECYDNGTESNSSRRKSAFLRLQPATPHTSTSRTTSSPHKGKGIDIETLGHRSNEVEVDVDVSFKAYALASKVVAAPSSSKVDGKMVSESPSRARRSRNRGTNSPVPKKNENQSVSPILMKVGIRKVAEAPDDSTKSSSSACSSLSAGEITCSMASPEGEILSKDDKRAGFCGTSSPSGRKKRKAVISCFSASVPTNLDTGVDVDNSVSSPSAVSMSDALGSSKTGCVENEPHISNLDDVVLKSVEKSISDTHMDSHDSQATNSVTCDDNVFKTRRLSSKHEIIAEQCRKVPRDGDDDDDESMKLSVDEKKPLDSQSVDVSDGKTTVSDIDVTNGIQEQRFTCAGPVIVSDESKKRRKLSQKACVSLGGDLGPSSSVKDDVLSLDRKRKFGIDVCDVNPKDNPCTCIIKRKSKPNDSVFTESCEFCSSANTLNSPPSGLYSVNYSEQNAEVKKSSDSLLPPEDVMGGAAKSLTTVISAFGDCPKAEVEHKNSNSSVEKISQPSYEVHTGYNKKGDDDLITAFKCHETELNRSESEAEVAKMCRNTGVHCIQPDNAVDLNDEPLVTDMECESNITVEHNLGIVSDCPLLCAQEMATSKPVVLSKSSKLNSPPMVSQVTTSNDIICGDDKKSESLKSMRALVAQSNSVFGGFRKNVKPVNSAAPMILPFAQKPLAVHLKYANKGASMSSPMSRQFSWRNDVTHGKTANSSSQASPVAKFPKKSLTPVPAKPRTWHRTLATSTTIEKPSSSTTPPQRPPNGKSLKVQDTSYVRKGNSLVRNSASSTTALGPHASTVSTVQEKPVDKNENGTLNSSGINNFAKSLDCLITDGRHARAPIEMLKRSPLSCAKKTSDCKTAYIGDCTSPLQVEPSEGMDNKVALSTIDNALSPSGDSEIVVGRSFADAGNLSDGVVQASNVKKVVYIKRKANQLIAASTSPEVSGRNMDNKLGLSSDNTYYKKRKHQLIRASSESNIQKMVSATEDSSNSRVHRAFNVYSCKSASKGPSSRVKSLKVSLVWKLGDAKCSNKGSAPLRSKQLLSQLLPWKRTTYRRTVWRASASSSDCSSLIKNRKLTTSRNQAVLYVRSGRGFSLKRSKVISLAGSLKWSKSMEKRSKKIDAEAALAVAKADSTARQKVGASCVSSETEIKKLPSHKSVHGLKLHRGERIFRIGLFRYHMDPSRRTLQRIPDEEAPDSITSKAEKYANKSYMPKRLLIGSDEYIRIGNGNQLVRDPKRRTRILASEKVRWSLHTARSRLAKKRKFCQFFTRFGRCNKSEGKCPYIHDSSKITVCTKFLKGLCADQNCKLTHKVIPDRMPDCSFFLQGSCSNESCPYRHVNVNPKASICESFLRGYCSEGNKCQKKHSYLCPEFEATGSCPRDSKCKLYHPKKSTSKKGKNFEDQRNIKGRYFDPGLTSTVAEAEAEATVLEKNAAHKNNGIVSEGGDLGDYISLDVSDDEEEESVDPNNEATHLSDFVAPVNSDAVSAVDLADYINLDNEAVENNYVNKEVMYLSEFDVLNYRSEDDELAKPLCFSDTLLENF